MGMISLILAIIAILIAGFAMFQNMSQNSAIQEISEKQIDFDQCKVVHTALNDPKTTSCDQVCGSQKQCIVAYEKDRASEENSPIITTQDTLVDCNEEINVGIFEDDEGPDEPNTIRRFSLTCICCDK